jgi:pimeloyl-ACP methyl ester carboxylesterase
MNRYSHGRIKLDYKRLGNGPKAILAFHGFGRNPDDWQVFQDVLGPKWCIYSFRLFYHGEDSDLDPYIPLGFEEWSSYLDAFFEEMEIQDAVLMGYSMGGRLIFGCLEHLSTPICGAILLAPDGIIPNTWYRFLSGTRIGRMIFRHSMRSPGMYLGIARTLASLGFIPDHRYRLFAENTEQDHQRDRLLNTWLFLSRLMYTPEVSTRLVIEKGLSDNLHVVGGRRDRVITTKGLRAWPFLRTNPSRLHELDLGHRLMNREVANYVRTYLLP